LKEKDKVLKEKDKVLKEKDEVLKEKDNIILKFAKSLKDNGKTPEEIQKETGLSKKDIDNL
jgi:hypothetical protein